MPDSSLIGPGFSSWIPSWIAPFKESVDDESESSRMSETDHDEDDVGNIASKDSSSSMESSSSESDSEHGSKLSLKGHEAIVDDESASDSDSVTTKTEEPKAVEPQFQPRIRRSRGRENANFQILEPASAAVAADAFVGESPSTAVVPSTPEENNWWTNLFSSAPETVESGLSGENTTIQKGEVVAKAAQNNITDNGQGMWGGLFGSNEPSLPPEEQARSLLPQIPPPRTVYKTEEINSFFVPLPTENSIELLGPKPMINFQGKVRGWPRRLAPYWSTSNESQTSSSSHNSIASGVSALAMFRVT